MMQLKCIKNIYRGFISYYIYIIYILSIFLFQLGKLLRVNKKVRGIISVPSRKTKFKMFALSALAFVLLVKTSQSSQDGGLKRLTGVTVLVICFWVLSMHILFLIINTLASLLLRLPLDQAKAVIILASQKTLSQAVAATVFLPEGVGKFCIILCSTYLIT